MELKRKINKIVVHCSATKMGKDFHASDIDKWHRRARFRCIGYHFVVALDGTIERGRDVNSIGAHVAGHNADSIGICYVGGCDKLGNAYDSRTDEQKVALRLLIQELRRLIGRNVPVYGHRDLSPDKNGDGVISPDEWLKECPCFNAQKEYNDEVTLGDVIR